MQEPQNATKTRAEIEAQIATLEKAIEMDGFKPVPDGAKLREHLYYRRMGAIDYLRWAIRTPEEQEEEEGAAWAAAERAGAFDN